MPPHAQDRRGLARGAVARRVVAAGAGAAALLGGMHAGADTGREEWFGSPVTGTRYAIGADPAARTKFLVAPDGRRFPSVAAVVQAELAAQTPLQRLMAPAILAAATDPARADESVDATFIFRRQPVYEAGVAARARANPEIEAALARQRAILDRIAPLRTLRDGRAPDLATAMRDEDALLTAEEKTTLREVRDAVHARLAKLRREVLAEAGPAVERDQSAFVEYLRSLPDTIDFGGSVTLNARSARLPARALAAIAERFPEILRVEPLGVGDGCLDNAVPSVGAGGWWSAGYNGSSNTLIALIDSGVDTTHPAMNGVVAASAVYHATAAAQTTYGENATAQVTDDLQGHGTNAAGVLCSIDSTYRGIAYGARILNAKAAFLNNTTNASSMYFADGRAAGDWAFNNGATTALLTFGGTGTNDGSTEMELFLDAAAFSLAVSSSIASKNLGPSSSTVGYPGGAFNAITCGNIDDNGTTTASDDFIDSASGRGPTTDGRQKPDLCAPGVNITCTAHDWEGGTSGSNPDFVSISPGTATGTSVVGPLVTGAFCLLQDYGAAAYPAGLKALLLTTGRKTVLTASGASTTHAAPGNDIGYGVLELGGAYTYRASVYEGQLTSSGPRYVLLKGGSLASGGRATLVWSRQVTSNGANIPTTYYPIQDLDLYVYDESSGSQAGSSASTLDPNEQVAVSSAVSTPVYKVFRAASSFTTNYSTEPFALAAEATTSTSVVSPPALACTFTQLATTVAGSASTTITVSVANSGGVRAFAPAVTLTLPAGYSITSGSNPQTLSAIAAGSSGTATWTVTAPSSGSGSRTITADAASTSYGESFAAATLNGSQYVDADPPAGTVQISANAPYTTTRSVTVTIAATDNHTGVAQMRVRNAGDAWGNWTTYATSVNTTLSENDGTKTFEAQFADGVGNLSQTVSDTIVYDTTAPAGSVEIAGGAGFANSPAVTLTNSVTDAGSTVAEARYSNDGTTWSAWSPYAATVAWTLAAGEGTRTVHAQWRDGAGNASGSATDTIVVETGPPAGSVVVAGGAAWTNDRSVTLTLDASDTISGVSDMRFSDDGSSWGSWQPYGASAPWTLPAGDGAKTVHAQFRDGAGNVSAAATDGIGLDATAPAGTVVIDGGASFTREPAVSLTLSATDALNDVTEMRFSPDSINWSSWEAYATSAEWTLTTGQGIKAVYVQFRDAVGNVSATASDSITVDTVDPYGTISIEGGTLAFASEQVALNLTWNDSGSGVLEARLSNDGTTWSDWLTVKASMPWTTEPGDGIRTVYVQYRDLAGNESLTYSDTILIDQTAPTGSFVLSGDAAYVLPWEDFTADTTSGDGAGGSGVAAFRTSGNGGTNWTPWAAIPPGGRVVVARPAGAADAFASVLGEFRDAAGNVSERASDTTYLIDGAAADVTQIASFTGAAGTGGDIDAVRMGLVAGDKLTLKLKTKTLVKKADVRLDLDLYGPAHDRLVTGRHPATSKTPGVAKFVAPATGEYWVLLRAAGTQADTGIQYTTTVTVAAAKGARAKKGAATPDGGAAPPAIAIPFDAVGGLKFAGTLTLPLADTATEPALLAPDGSPVPLTFVRGKKGAMKLSAASLTGGAGTYVLTIPASAPVKYSFSLKPPKRGKLAE